MHFFVGCLNSLQFQFNVKKLDPKLLMNFSQKLVFSKLNFQNSQLRE